MSSSGAIAATSRVETVTKLSSRTQTMRFMHRAAAAPSSSSSSSSLTSTSSSSSAPAFPAPPRPTPMASPPFVHPPAGAVAADASAVLLAPPKRLLLACVVDVDSTVTQAADAFSSLAGERGAVAAGRRSFGAANSALEGLARAAAAAANGGCDGVDVGEHEYRAAMGGGGGGAGAKRPRQDAGGGGRGGGGRGGTSRGGGGLKGGGRYTQLLGRARK